MRGHFVSENALIDASGTVRYAVQGENAESDTRETRSSCFVFNRRSPETVLDLAKMSLVWLRELLGLERAWRGRPTVLEPDAAEVVEKKVEDEKVVVYADRRPITRSRHE